MGGEARAFVNMHETQVEMPTEVLLCTSLFVCFFQVLLKKKMGILYILIQSRVPASFDSLSQLQTSGVGRGGVVRGLERSRQQLLQRGIVQVVDGDNVVQMLQVALLVAHEVRDSGPGELRQVPQALHVFKRHLS